jgi:hypothetical protein
MICEQLPNIENCFSCSAHGNDLWDKRVRVPADIRHYQSPDDAGLLAFRNDRTCRHLASIRFWTSQRLVVSSRASGSLHVQQIASVTFLKLDQLSNKHFPGVCPSEGMCSIPIISFDVEHDLIDEFLFRMPDSYFDDVPEEDMEPSSHLVKPRGVRRSEVMKGQASSFGSP